MTDAYYYSYLCRFTDRNDRVMTQPIGEFNGKNVYTGIFTSISSIRNISKYYDISYQDTDETILFIKGSECEWYDPSLIGNPYHIPCSGSVDGENSVIHDKASGWYADVLFEISKQYYWEENCYLKPVKYAYCDYVESYDDSHYFHTLSFDENGSWQVTTRWFWADRWRTQRVTQHTIRYIWYVMDKKDYGYEYTRTYASPVMHGEMAPLHDPYSHVTFAYGPGDLGLDACVCLDDSWTVNGYSTSYKNLSYMMPKDNDHPAGRNSLSFERREIHIDPNFVFRNRGNHVLSASLRSKCYVEAMSSLECNTNNIANIMSILDICSGFRDFDLKKLKNIPAEVISKAKHLGKTASETWLSYRYVYNTTLSDIAEISRFARTITKLTQTLRGGQSTSGGTCRIKVKTVNKQLSPLYEQLQLASKYGIAPDLYNIWDLVPYSFIVDWFINIGGVLEQLTNYGKTLKYDITSITTSYSWSDIAYVGNIPIKMSHYERLVTTSAPPFIPYTEDTSTKTWMMRIVDGLSLLIGR